VIGLTAVTLLILPHYHVIRMYTMAALDDTHERFLITELTTLLMFCYSPLLWRASYRCMCPVL
jgi:hypothetical protein